LLKLSFKSLVRNWWPVAVWLAVIRAESTDTASASNTGALLYRVLAFVWPTVNAEFVDRLDGVLRKTGHFVGYAILGALVLIAIRRTNRDRLSGLLKRAWGSELHDLWRWEWATLSALFTVVTASFDEIHQSFIPSRTGRWQDVVLDTCGASAMLALMYVLARRETNSQKPVEVDVESTPVR
jgi:VanZ family protein